MGGSVLNVHGDIEDGWYLAAVSPIAHCFRWVTRVSHEMESACGLKRRNVALLREAPPTALRCKLCEVTEYHRCA